MAERCGGAAGHVHAENELWSGLLSVFLSELETLWCLCTQTVAQDLVSTDSRWLASLSVLHGWLAAVCCVVRSGSAPLITLRAGLCRPGVPSSPSLTPFPQRSRQLLLVLGHTWIWIHPFTSRTPSSMSGPRWCVSSLPPPCSVDSNNSY